MAEQKVLSFEDWVQLHQSIFKAHGFPISKLAPTLYDKLLEFKKDNLDDFDIEMKPEPTLFYNPKGSKTTIKKESNIFISEHVWSADAMDFYKEFRENTQLQTMLQPFLKDYDEKTDHNRFPIFDKNDNHKLDLYGVKNQKFIDVYDKDKNKDLEALDIRNTTFTTQEIIDNINHETLKAIAFDENQIKKEEIIKTFPNVQFINGDFTEKWDSWVISFIANNSQNPENVVKLNLSKRNIQTFKKEAFSKFTNLLSIDIRENPFAKKGTFDVKLLKEAVPSVLSILCDKDIEQDVIDSKLFVFVNDVDHETNDKSIEIPDVIWSHMQNTGADWALCNEKCLAIHHKLNCNFVSMPCGSPYLQKSYFVFWPIQDINKGDEVTSNLFIYIPFIDESSVDPKPEKLKMKILRSKFKSSVTSKRPLKAFIEYEPFIKNLHSDKFVVTNDPQEADLLWLTKLQQSDFTNIYATGKLLNQIEGERYITCKDYLYTTCTQYMGEVDWLPETYILSDENDIFRFLKRHQYLKEHSESTTFIVKAFNLTRAASMVVSNSTSEILKHASGQYRLAQRYIWNPLNIFGCKFDLRFIILLKSVKPFELFVYKVFWPRLSPKKWALDDLSDYERHFTVMNYVSPDKVTHKTYVDFISQFKVENKGIEWEEVLQRIYDAIRDMIVCGCQKMVQSPFTKSFYGVDVMLTKDYKPVILECNFQPDCLRACDLCPTFVDDIFEVLFTDQPVTNPNVVQLPL